VRGLLDTSVFVAREEGRELQAGLLPDEAAISIVTLAELEIGVHMARSEDTRARRLKTLGATKATYAALPLDERVASAFAELVAAARRAGRRPRVQDAWIAATARVHLAPIYTQDRDFDGLPGVEVVHV
jgi:predicted nucleic acid-binding protein